jgi:hypothetical protein
MATNLSETDAEQLILTMTRLYRGPSLNGAKINLGTPRMRFDGVCQLVDASFPHTPITLTAPTWLEMLAKLRTLGVKV